MMFEEKSGAEKAFRELHDDLIIKVEPAKVGLNIVILCIVYQISNFQISDCV